MMKKEEKVINYWDKDKYERALDLMIELYNQAASPPFPATMWADAYATAIEALKEMIERRDKRSSNG